MKTLQKTAKALRLVRKKRTSVNFKGSDKKPRVTVFISHTNTSVQAIDDLKGCTVSSVLVKGKTMKHATEAGTALATVLIKKHISECIFDRSGYQYHGRVKAIATALRDAGIHV